MLDAQQIKRDLKRKGWSYRRASTVIGRHYTWIHHVLNGHERSAPVLKALNALPDLNPKHKANER
jgi:hypothetical protein